MSQGAIYVVQFKGEKSLVYESVKSELTSKHFH